MMNALDRRRLLTSGAAAAVLAASGLGAKAAPASGGTLRVGLSGGSSADTFDGRRRFGAFMKLAGAGCVFDCLTEIGPDGTLAGELAESWDSARGGRSWAFDLRRGAVFHDGRALTPAAVVATFRRHLVSGPASAAAGLLADVVAVRASGPRQVTFELAAPNVDFPFLLADPQLIVHPETSPAITGTGLYRLRSFDPGVLLVADRVRDHWKGGRAGWFDRVELIALPTRQARLRALLDGRVDVIDDLDPHAVETLGRMSRVQVLRRTGNGQLLVSLPAGLSRPRAALLRAALVAALPRQTLVDHMLAGHGRTGSDTPFGPRNRYASTLAAQAHDAEAGRRALSALGMAGLPLRLPAVPGEAAEALQRDLSASGLSLAARGQEGLGLGWTSGRATEDWALSMPPAGLAEWVGTDAARGQLKDLATAGRAASDSAVRTRIYADVQRLLAAQGTAVIPVQADFLAAATQRLAQGPRIGAAWPLDDFRIAERWWFA